MQVTWGMSWADNSNTWTKFDITVDSNEYPELQSLSPMQRYKAMLSIAKGYAGLARLTRGSDQQSMDDVRSAQQSYPWAFTS